MEVIDGHVFLGKSIYVDHSPENLITEMDRLGIEVSIVVAPPPGPFYEEANKFVRNAVRKHPDRLMALYRANPQLEEEDGRVRAALEGEGFVGIQLDPTNDGYMVVNTIVEPVIQATEGEGGLVYVHSGDSIFCPPEGVAELASKFRDVTFVTPMSRRAPRAAKGHGNLYLTTRPFPTLAFKRGYAEEFDLDRFIFASDAPIGVPEIELRRVELADLQPEVKRKILGDNLRRILAMGA